MDHGIRLYTGILNDYKVKELSAQLESVFPNAVSASDNLYRGFMDIGFETSTEADEASLAIITSGHKPVRISRTRHKDDNSIFISLLQLPTNMPRKELLEALMEGLSAYGTVVKLEMEQSLLMPQLSAPRAIAILKPKPHILNDITLIPRCAFIIRKNGIATSNFQVRPEQAPPVCAHCSFIGHRANACPKTVEGLKRIMEGNEDEDINMDEDPQTNSNSAKYGYPWGEHAEYNVVTPVSTQERNAAKRAIAEETLTSRIQEKVHTITALNQNIKANKAIPVPPKSSSTSHQTESQDSIKPPQVYSFIPSQVPQQYSEANANSSENMDMDEPITASCYPRRHNRSTSQLGGAPATESR